jgi:membrane-associated phospholipid phosphatase
MRVRAFFLLAIGAAPAFAQSAPAAAPSRDPILRTGDAAIFAAALAGSALLVRYDVGITAWKGVPVFQNSTRVRRTLDATAFLGGPGSFAVDAAIWGVGRIANNRDRWTDGETALEAAALSGAVTFLLKGIAGRARPTLDSTRADNFKFGRGFWAGDDYASFPSGHTTAAFAFATAITTRLAQRRSSSASWAAPALFSIATVTAIGRLYNHRHWMSDCLTGAAIGTIGGLVAARWHERHP